MGPSRRIRRFGCHRSGRRLSGVSPERRSPYRCATRVPKRNSRWNAARGVDGQVRLTSDRDRGAPCPSPPPREHRPGAPAGARPAAGLRRQRRGRRPRPRRVRRHHHRGDRPERLREVDAPARPGPAAARPQRPRAARRAAHRPHPDPRGREGARRAAAVADRARGPDGRRPRRPRPAPPPDVVPAVVDGRRVGRRRGTGVDRHDRVRHPDPRSALRRPAAARVDLDGAGPGHRRAPARRADHLPRPRPPGRRARPRRTPEPRDGPHRRDGAARSQPRRALRRAAGGDACGPHRGFGDPHRRAHRRPAVRRVRARRAGGPGPGGRDPAGGADRSAEPGGPGPPAGADYRSTARASRPATSSITAGRLSTLPKASAADCSSSRVTTLLSCTSCSWA